MFLADYAQTDRIVALPFGKFKVGKTWGAATWPRPNFIQFDRAGLSTLLNPQFIEKHGFKSELQFQEFWDKNKDHRGGVRAHNAFDDACRYFDDCMKPGKRDSFDTWVVDSGTTLSEAAMNKALVLMSTNNLGIKSNTLSVGHNTGMIAPKQQDFGAERSMLEQFIQMIMDTDKHFLFLCHEKVLTAEDGTVTGIVPLLTGKSVEAVSIKFNDVWNVQRMKEGMEWKVVVKTQQTSVLKVGSRLGIPENTPFEYTAIKKVLDNLREQRAAKMQTAPATTK
jgi:hypothetical protein